MNRNRIECTEHPDFGAWLWSPVPDVDLLWSRSQCELGIAGRRRLLDKGADPRTLFRDVGALPVQPVGAGSWEPADNGPRHLVFASREDGVLVDLIAWLPGNPSRRHPGRGWRTGAPERWVEEQNMQQDWTLQAL